MLEIAGGIILAYLAFVIVGGVISFLAQRRYDRYGSRQDQYEAQSRE